MFLLNFFLATIRPNLLGITLYSTLYFGKDLGYPKAKQLARDDFHKHARVSLLKSRTGGIRDRWSRQVQ